jgi:monovalent cation:H+ antiporter-2, CPA2 family
VLPAMLILSLTLLGSALIAVAICRWFNLPSLLGYLAVGIILGPHALNVIPDTEETRQLSEFGIVFLMFSIGLEFSLAKLQAMKRIVLGLGMSQVGSIIILAALSFPIAGYDWKLGIILGGALALSSTAIVSKLLVERQELNSAHGREVMGITLAQDIAVVPLLILIPAFAKPSDLLLQALGFSLIKIICALVFILVVGQKTMRQWFHLITRQRSHELFMLNLFLVSLGLAALTALAGLSMALGAFLAGMLIAETEYRHEVEEDIQPFRDMLLGLFFITTGMQLNVMMVVHHWHWVLLLFFFPLLLKLGSTALLSRGFGSSWATALRTSIYLAQGSEFAMVLINLASQSKLIPQEWVGVLLAPILLSMLASPFMIQHADAFIRRFTSNDWMLRATELHKMAVQTMMRNNHVIVAGFGRSGQNLARFLEQESIPFVALDYDPQRVKEAAGGSDKIIYGDTSRKEVLMAAGMMRARAIVISFDALPVALKILHHAQSERPDLPVIVRSRDDEALHLLYEAGASEVIPEVLEGSLMLASQTLLMLGIPMARINQRLNEVRAGRYSLLKGFYHGLTDTHHVLDNSHPRLHPVHLPEAAWAVNKTLSDLGIEQWVEIRSIRRKNHRFEHDELSQIQCLLPADTLILLGIQEHLMLAEEQLLKGR